MEGVVWLDEEKERRKEVGGEVVHQRISFLTLFSRFCFVLLSP